VYICKEWIQIDRDTLGRFAEGHSLGKRFEKGQKPWNTGTTGISKPNRGSFKKGRIPWNKGKKMPNMKQWCKGKKHSLELRKKMSEGRKGKHSGSKHWNWKGGISDERIEFYESFEFKDWSRKVMKRDNYTCQDCGKRDGSRLNAHHMIPRSKDISKAFSLDNGKTLCVSCHRKIHKKLREEVRAC